MRRDSVYLNGVPVLCFGNVASFEQIVYLVSGDVGYLYFYPGFLRDSTGREEEPGEPAMVKAWHDCGVMIVVDDEECAVKCDMPYMEPGQFCGLPSIRSFRLLPKDNIVVIYDTGD